MRKLVNWLPVTYTLHFTLPVTEDEVLAIDTTDAIAGEPPKYFVSEFMRNINCYYKNIDACFEPNVINKTMFSDADAVPSYIRIYNVGQGNYVQIHFSDGKDILFDVGYTKYKIDKKQSEICQAVEEIKNIKPEMVILSHWDSDHIRGAAFSNHRIYDAVWIVPDVRKLCHFDGQGEKITGISDFGLRIIAFILKKHPEHFHVVSEKIAQQCIYHNEDGYLDIWTGKRAKTSLKKGEKSLRYTLSKANNFGLMLAIKNHKKIFLPGDCDYKLVKQELVKEPFDFVLASHHCSKMAKFPFHFNSKRNGQVIISYGIANTHGHPDSGKMGEIDKAGYEITQTIGHKWIRIDLQRKVKLIGN